MSVTKVPMRGVNTAVDTAAGDDANIGYTSAEGLILTGQGSTNDVTIKNDADADVIKIATGGTTTTFTGDVTMTGTTPTLTIGDAGAEDAAIVFDGNAQDFHIGLDDTADSLAIGLGSALGTTDHMVFDATGAITKPLQPCVMVHPASVQTDLTQGSSVEVVWGTERFDVNSDFASNTFTAPVTGKYLVCVEVRLDNLDTAAEYVHLYVVSSNRNYNSSIRDYRKFSADVPRWGQSFTGIIDMDASDTLVIQLYFAGGSSQSDVQTESYFSIGLFA